MKHQAAMLAVCLRQGYIFMAYRLFVLVLTAEHTLVQIANFGFLRIELKRNAPA